MENEIIIFSRKVNRHQDLKSSEEKWRKIFMKINCEQIWLKYISRQYETTSEKINMSEEWEWSENKSVGVWTAENLYL